MNDLDKIKEANIIYQAFHIPVYFYHNRQLVHARPMKSTATNPPSRLIEKLLLQSAPVIYTTHQMCFGKIHVKSDPLAFFVLGPISPLTYTMDVWHSLFRQYVTAPEQREAFREFFQTIPTMTYIDFFYKLIMANYTINHEELPLEYFWENTNDDTCEINITRSEQITQMYDKRENETPNNSHEIEGYLTSLIESGSIDALHDFLHQAPVYQGGIIATDNLRLQKNYFITTVTLATRSAINAGLSEETAYHLSDLYISNVEKTVSINEINLLFIQALTSFTEQVHEIKKSFQNQFSENEDPLIRQTMNYVKKNVHQKLSVSIVADALGYHRSYLSAHFSTALGFHLNDYIYRCKLEEAKSLLRFTDKSISEISSYLYFSSQSHFQKRFRETFNMTPARYRQSGVCP